MTTIEFELANKGAVTRSTSITMKALNYHGPEKYARGDKLRPAIQDIEKLWDRNISPTPASGALLHHTVLQNLSRLKVPMRNRIPLLVCYWDGGARFI
jgi:hypothetical protein